MTDTIDKKTKFRPGTMLAHKRPDKTTRNAEGVTVALVGVDRGTKEAMQHRPLMVPPKELLDARKAAKAATSLDELFMRLDIGESEYSAGLEFEKQFRVARFDGLTVPSLMRIPGGARGDLQQHVYDARDRVYDMLNAVGGSTSMMGKALWHIIGEGKSLRHYTAEVRDAVKKSTGKATDQGGGQKKSPPRDAWKGAVICALEALVAAKVNYR